jgi:hypothetical protein
MKKEWLVKTLALVVVVLFISVSFQPIIAEKTITVEKESDYEKVNFEKAKEYLFLTLVDISNNPEVKEFLYEHKHDLFTNKNNNYNCKDTIKKIWLQKPKLTKSILFTKPEMIYDYLDTYYNSGFEIFSIIGKEELSNTLESVKTNPELFNELKNIITNNKELSNKISVLKEMNQELKSNPFSWDFPIICFILICCFLSLQFVMFTFLDLMDNALMNHKLLVFLIIAPFCLMSILTNIPIINLIFLFDCDIPYEPPGD